MLQSNYSMKSIGHTSVVVGLVLYQQTHLPWKVLNERMLENYKQNVLQTVKKTMQHS